MEPLFTESEDSGRSRDETDSKPPKMDVIPQRTQLTSKLSVFLKETFWSDKVFSQEQLEFRKKKVEASILVMKEHTRATVELARSLKVPC